MNTQIIEKIIQQKNRLIHFIPELEQYFIDIFFEKLKTTIPFIPIRAFRDFHLTTLYPLEMKTQQAAREHTQATNNDSSLFPQVIQQTFFSSGSTNAIRARHSFSAGGLEIYAKHAIEGLKNFLRRFQIENVAFISLVPHISIWKNSSLSFMLNAFSLHKNIHWCQNAQEFLEILKKINQHQDILLFGTTFHHLTLIQETHDFKLTKALHDILKNKKVFVIDTGGTKGRTKVFSSHNIQKILQNFYRSKNSQIFSEYGMCELGSQAWSHNDKHNGIFIANKTLYPYSIDIKNNKILSANKIGYLGFVDLINQDSYPAFITEDLGKVISHSKRIFKLYGRAPNASVKGCSLNVQTLHTNLSLFENPVKTISNKKNTLATSIFLLKNFLKSLDKRFWNQFDLHDLKNSLISLDKMNFLSKNSFNFDNLSTIKFNLENLVLNKINFDKFNFENKNILLIAAANTPIAFVYPLILCGIQNAKTFTLKIPSIRINDPLNNKIQNQIKDLFKNFSGFFPKTQFNLLLNSSLTKQFSSADCVMAFGTNETIQLLKDQCLNKIFIGFGDIKNSLVVDLYKQNIDSLAQLCSAWNGRGCLTPICLFIGNDWKQKHTLEFFQKLSWLLKERLYHCKNYIIHDHQRLYYMAQLKAHSKAFKKNYTHLPNKILFSEYATVIDLSFLKEKEIKNFKFDFSNGGSGFIHLISKELRHMFPELVQRSIFPSLNEFYEVI